MTAEGYQTRPFSRWRAVMSDAMRVAKEKNYIYGLFEMDVTEARRLIHAYKARTGEDFSFTAFVVACIAHAVDENKAIHALRRGSQLIVFDDVDVNVQVEHDVDGVKIVAAYIVRAANRKTAQQIHSEIRAAQRQKVAPDSPFERLPGYIWAAEHMPSFVRRIFLRRILHDPFMIRRLGGTINLTSVGMFGSGAGWGISIAETSLTVMIGGIGQKAGLIDGKLCAREMLSITLGFDHDVVDGAPAARFAARLKALIEAGDGLPT